MVVLFMTAVILILLITDYYIQYRRHQAALVQADLFQASSPELDNYYLPDGFFAAPAHLWGRLLPHGNLKIGIDPFLHYAVGTIDSIQLPQKGESVRKGDVLLTLNQDGKALAVRSPIAGVVQTINPTIGKGHFSQQVDQNWALEIKPDDLSSGLRSFHIGSEAKELLKDDLKRFREFINDASYAGGTPVSGTLAQLNAEGWNKFTEKFLTVEP